MLGFTAKMTVSYLHLPSGQLPPALAQGAYRAVVVIEDSVTDEWRTAVSEWLVLTGCLYMLAWGERCSEWDDSVDYALLSAFDFGEIPDDRFIMTTWHDDEPATEVFWFAEHGAYHPTVDLERTLILHIAPHEREAELLTTFREAQSLD